MKHMPTSDPSNEDTRRRAAKRNAVKLWIGFICICVVIGVFGTLKLSKGKLDEAENQENAVAANECLNQAFGQTANGTIIFRRIMQEPTLTVDTWCCFLQTQAKKQLKSIETGQASILRV